MLENHELKPVISSAFTKLLLIKLSPFFTLIIFSSLRLFNCPFFGKDLTHHLNFLFLLNFIHFADLY